MNDTEILIVGLGNPGPEYVATRHNVGFLLVDELAARWGITVDREKWNGLLGSGRVGGRRIHLFKPMSFMNRSGQPVVGCCQFFKISQENLLVIHDDLDMVPGRVKLVMGGGAGGHNGIKSISQSLGSPEYLRLKLGIGRPGQGGVHAGFPVEKYVLSAFTAEDASAITARYEAIVSGLEMWLHDGVSKAMTFLNRLKGPEAE